MGREDLPLHFERLLRINGPDTPINGTYSMLDHLQGPFMENVFDQIQHKTQMFLRTKKEGKYEDYLEFIVGGAPGSGKTTIVETLRKYFDNSEFTYDFVLYENYFARQSHEKVNWNRLNYDMYRGLVKKIRPSKKPHVRIAEIPIVSRYIPGEIPGQAMHENRDRGPGAIRRLAPLMNQRHTYILAVTADYYTRQAAVQTRGEILKLPAEEVNEFLIKRNLLPAEARVDPEEIKILVENMAQTHHLDTILAELRHHQWNYLGFVSVEAINRVITGRHILKKADLSINEIMGIIEMLSFNNFLVNRLGVPQECIINALNLPNDALQKEFFIQHSR